VIAHAGRNFLGRQRAAPFFYFDSPAAASDARALGPLGPVRYVRAVTDPPAGGPRASGHLVEVAYFERSSANCPPRVCRARDTPL
jgi:hypothetical protein